MHVEAIVFLLRQRQFGEEPPLRCAQPPARPLDRGLSRGIHGLGRRADRVVVIAAHGDSAAMDEVHHGLDRPFGVGAIADDVAEADDPLGAPRARRRKTGAERLPVGMDIRKDRKTHIFLRAVVRHMV
jgi:hypothetical protein